MCDLNCVNLIDLSLEEDFFCANTQTNTENNVQVPKENSNFVLPPWRKCESFENNPFDSVQKLAERLNDPFDIVEKEASLKALQSFKPPAEVQLDKLLSLSDDNIVSDEKPATSLVAEKLRAQDADFESPPVTFNKKQHRDSLSATESDSNPNSSAETSISAILKKNTEHRKRLLKLSFSNVAFSSPINHKDSLEGEDILSTPVSSVLSKGADFEDHLISSESPLKLVEDDDLIAEQAPNIVDAEKQFEADLEKLQIPMLNQLHSPTIDTTSGKSVENIIEGHKRTPAGLENVLPNIEAIQAKLNAKKEEINKNHQIEILSLIHNLKSLICDEMVDISKKQEISNLLETLSSAIKPINKHGTPKSSEMQLVAPQPVKRENTFDVDLQKKQHNYFDKQPFVAEMPNCMVSSSATYDGETNEEKEDLNLPEIDPISPRASAIPSHNQVSYSSNCENNYGTEIESVIEQLNKLLVNNADNDPPDSNKPTFIVLMNSNQIKHSNINNSSKNNVDNKQISAFISNYLENSINDGSPDLTKVNSIPRRRAQSLSIHDKVNIVRLPLQQSTPRFIQKENSAQLYKSAHMTTPAPSFKKKPEFETPTRMVRRNSYSNGTPYTAEIGLRRTGFGSEIKKKSTQIERILTSGIYHQGQNRSVAKPTSMPSNNLPIYKPDLKKKTKHNTESIVKSSGPLKATIPIKKVAPMLKTSPPISENNKKSDTLHNISLQSQAIRSKMPVTPFITKTSSNLSAEAGYPTACSTPAVSTLPLKRTSGPVNKQRYSFMSATPNLKSSVISSTYASNLKRRSITEFKSKSVLKPRVSSTGLKTETTGTSLSKTSIGSMRLSISAGARICKTPVKTTPCNAPAVKSTSRLCAPISVGDSALSTKNKENKHP